jgi:hypothetical protein
MVLAIPDVDDDASIRNRRAGSEEQSRHLLGDAGRGVRALHGNASLTAFCRDRYKTVLLPNQVAADGSFPEELRRTKPYGYSLFNLDAMTTVCQILSDRDERSWRYELRDGRGIRRAVAFLFPYIENKRTWPHRLT